MNEASKIHDSVDLFFCEGSSDKVYHAQIIDKGNDLYEVAFQYGRHGHALQSGTKTSSPVSLKDAQKTFYGLVRQKSAKGYQPITGNAGRPVHAPVGQAPAKSGPRAQLLNVIDAGAVNTLIYSPLWGMQQKMDGERRMVAREKSDITGFNRSGLPVALPESLAFDVAALPCDCLLDGEIIGDVLYVFDLLKVGSEDISCQPFVERFARLQQVVSRSLSKISLVPLFQHAADKDCLYERVKAQDGEGVVFKCLDAPYTPGRPASGGPQLKFRFWESVTTQVLSVHPTKRSVAIGMRDLDGLLVGVGNVAIPKNKSIPAVGDRVEIRYLYAFRGGSLYQPLYLGVRTDLDEADSMDILKYKSESAVAA